ncbi:MAG TPA: SPFH domain-containing protein [Phycisphaerae bacterium]|nr:SPFH domain-containing protein [Phycisphaerae bacterium]
MTETPFTRSRRASLWGLVLQILAAAGIFALSEAAQSSAMFVLTWFVAGGIPLWFVTLLVFRQRELAALEAMDLEELRREKKAIGAAEGMFDEEGGGGLAYRVAEARLQWMQRWLVPAISLLHTAFLAGMGLFLWFRVGSDLPPLNAVHLPISMVVLTVIMLLFFVFSRYASGMGREPQRQLLRACGSYALGNTLGALAVLVSLGVYKYAEVSAVERAVGFALCALMIVLAAETLFSFVLEIYRPRMRGAEPRASFDSRLLGLISEPGGIASTIAEAMNYQFGFEVSQTWFYQLLQKWLVPLLGAGLLILWLLTSVVVVQPGQHALIERFGRQLNADAPYPPGFYWKLPWPVDIACKYDTGNLHQINIGFKQFDARPSEDSQHKTGAALWTDERHFGQQHFNFLIPVPPGPQTVETGSELDDETAGLEQSWPVNTVRLDMVAQYRIDEKQLANYSRNCEKPHQAMLDVAWEETVRFAAAWDIFSLLGDKYGTAGQILKGRLQERVDELGLGLEVVYVGMQNVHPDKVVATEFRKVVNAEQEKIAAIREALVKENEILSAVAGDRRRARELAQAIENITQPTIVQYQTAESLSQVDPALLASLRARFDELQPQFLKVISARWQLEEDSARQREIELEFELGLGRNEAERGAAAGAVYESREQLLALEAELREAMEPVSKEAAAKLGEQLADALLKNAEAGYALQFWNRRLERLLPGLQGEAAAILAAAQAERWMQEMRAAQQVARLAESVAYRAAPRLYQVRKYLAVLVEGIQNTRKFFLAFDPAGRQVRVRYLAEEQAAPAGAEIETRMR